MEFGKVVFVGAGPGDPELISVKGLRAVQRADVILYDALVSKLLLEEAPNAKCIYVGKRRGHCEFSQDEINQLLVFYARRGNNVVRLKGGDPNIFGRGHEEAEFVTRYGIHIETINGISSVIAAPSAAGIPLTKRGISESFWVVTGTVSDGSVSKDFHLAAKSSATLVVLMGISRLSEIAAIVTDLRGADEPIAIVFGATCPGEQIIVATASTITNHISLDTPKEQPGVIVIGKVVNERNVLLPMLESGVKTLINS